MKDKFDKISYVLNIDKAAEIEFTVAHDEKKFRIEFNRRILNLQLTLLTGLASVWLFKPFDNIDPFALQFGCLCIMSANIVFFLEISQNNYYISAAASFIHRIFRGKYKYVALDDFPEWDIYLKEVSKGKSYLACIAFSLDAHFFMCILLFIIPLLTLANSMYEKDTTQPAIIYPYLFFVISLSILCIIRHISTFRIIDNLVKDEELAKLKNTHGI